MGFVGPDQKELHKEVMLENAKNLLSLGLPVPREDFISHVERGDLRNSCTDSETWFDMKEMNANLKMISKKDLFQYSEYRAVFAKHNRNRIRKEHCERNTHKKALRKSSRVAKDKNIHPEEKTPECHECDKSFLVRFSLAKHQKIPAGEKPYKCKKHGKALRERSTAKHERIHTEKQSYKCNQCGKDFQCNSKLAQHQRIHTGEKPYKCKECGKAFIHHPSLRIHTGDKLYHCNECGKAFYKELLPCSTSENPH
ncbi:zinc finger protein 383-like [Sarcophilus harrisii]|uniref:zinc finger protein 383-like n=1 Tax=Sarcophilus harrisii TaxID=9305 RepID=UPI001301B5EA|nr:zinc finger protein 383-like [Sarcophilus harrisii]